MDYDGDRKKSRHRSNRNDKKRKIRDEGDFVDRKYRNSKIERENIKDRGIERNEKNKIREDVKKKGGKIKRRKRSRSFDRDQSRSRSRSRSRSIGGECQEDSSHSRSLRKKHKKYSKHDHKKYSSQERRSRERKNSKKRKSHENKSKSDGHTKVEKVKNKKLYDLGPIHNKPPSSPLDSVKDYFAYHSCLRVYLYREERLYFEDLTSEQARYYFEAFVKRYNSGKLPTIYYAAKGLPPEILEESKRTKHKWCFKTTKGENATLDVIKAGVRKQTEYDSEQFNVSRQKSNDIAQRIDNNISFSKLEGKAFDTKYKNAAEDFNSDHRISRRLRDHVRATYEELSGEKPMTGYERMQQQKHQQSEKQHSASKMKEEMAMGGVEDKYTCNRIKK